MILVGNKSDLQEDRVVSVEEGKELAKYMKCPYVEMRCSGQFGLFIVVHF